MINVLLFALWLSCDILNMDGSVSQLFADNTVAKTNIIGVTAVTPENATFTPAPRTAYEAVLDAKIKNLEPGAALDMQIVLLDEKNREIGRIQNSPRFQLQYLTGKTRRFTVAVPADAAPRLRAEILLGANPITVQIKSFRWEKKVEQKPFPGLYGAPDPEAPPEITRQQLRRLKPASAQVIRQGNAPILIIDGKKAPFFAYRGKYDYRKFAKAGANIIITSGTGSHLYWSTPWNRAAEQPDGTFDFSRLEKDLMRIHAASPDLRVIVSVNCDVDSKFLENHPEAIFTGSDGRRGIARHVSFAGYGDKVNDTMQTHWAQSYAAEVYQQHVEKGLRHLAKFLKNSPAGNIVIGFSLTGGHDGQFVQWEYSGINGHADYSGGHRLALVNFLRERYRDDATLRHAWGDPNLTLANAAMFRPEEYRSQRYFRTDNPLGRKITDCREFASIATARMLRRFGRTLKKEFGRPCIIQTWYSSAIWQQLGRSSLAELAKDGDVNIVSMVSDYAPPRLSEAPGASANFAIGAANLRDLLFVQEMDHRTWRTQVIPGWNYTAYPSDPADFRSQLLRDAASVLTAGGYGFYMYDMMGSWYNDPAAMAVITQCGIMAKTAAAAAGSGKAAPAAIFIDERARFQCESLCGDFARKSWQLSGIDFDVYHLSDLTDPRLPDYRMYLVLSPATIRRSELDALKKHAMQTGKVLYIAGETGFLSSDFTGSAAVMAELGLQIDERNTPMYTITVPEKNCPDPLLADVRGKLGLRGSAIGKNGRVTHLPTICTAVITDPAATILGRRADNDDAVLAVKRFPGKGTLIYAAQSSGVSPQLLHNAAREANIAVHMPGNASGTGRNIGFVHKLGNNPGIVRFGREVDLINPADGSIIKRAAADLHCAPGDTQIIMWKE